VTTLREKPKYLCAHSVKPFKMFMTTHDIVDMWQIRDTKIW